MDLLNRFESEHPLLICDRDQRFLTHIKADPKASSRPLVLAGSYFELEKKLAEAGHYSAIFLSPTIRQHELKTDLPKLMNIVRKDRPSTPIFCVVDSSDEIQFTAEELRNLTIHRVVAKPLTYAGILKLVQSAQFTFDARSARERASTSQPLFDRVSGVADSDFSHILARNVLPGATSYFDVYVRLGADHYVKILRQGDTLSRERLDHFLGKGVERFYLRKEVQEQYLKYCDHLSTAVLQHPRVSTAVKASMIGNVGEEVISFMRASGLSERCVSYAERFSVNIRTVVQQFDAKDGQALHAYLSETANLEHGVATAMFASLLALPLKLTNERSATLIGIPALFHDIGLQGMPEKFATENESALTQQELKLYHTHPAVGAAMLSKIRGVDAVAVQAVAQHHERRSRKGFPNRLGSGSINRVAEIVGISETFVNLLKQARQNPLLNPVREMEAHHFNGFSAPIISAFKTFFKT